MSRSTLGFMALLLLPLAPVLSAAELRDEIDAHVQDAWKRENIEPSPLASDGEFLRRVYLDLCGTIPTYDETVAFLNESSSDKRAKLIDRLLEDPRYAVHQGRVWDMLLFGRSPVGFDARERDGFQKWIHDEFAKNTPYDEICSQLLRAEGNTVEQGAPMFLVQYKSRPEDCTEAVTSIFLGVQLQCARCHDHPFEDVKQVDFYGMAGFFVRLEVVSTGKKDGQTKLVVGEKNTGEILFTGPAIDQKPGQKGEPVTAKFLRGENLEEPPLPEGVEDPKRFDSGKLPPNPHFSRKNALADWITDPDNPYFAKAAANKLWAQYLGRGLVHPVDHISPSNPATHPELLDRLAAALVEMEFDIHKFVRELLNSETYQRSSAGQSTEARPLWYERAATKPLSAEMLASAWRTATRYVEAEKAAGQKIKEEDPFFGLTNGYMLRFFGRPTDGTGQFNGGLHEHLYLNNGQVWSLISSRPESLLHQLNESEKSLEDRVQRLYLSTLNRPADELELAQMSEFLRGDKEPTGEQVEIDSDLWREAIWALLTCSEFRFNH